MSKVLSKLELHRWAFTMVVALILIVFTFILLQYRQQEQNKSASTPKYSYEKKNRFKLFKGRNHKKKHKFEVASTSTLIGETFNSPRIPSTAYKCSKHGIILAQHVKWDEYDRPFCPECNKNLENFSL